MSATLPFESAIKAVAVEQSLLRFLPSLVGALSLHFYSVRQPRKISEPDRHSS